MKPEFLTLEQFNSLKAGGNVLEKDRYGEKVILLKDGTYLKLFRRKRLISSALWYPYANRFINNSKRLKLKNIACPEPIAFFKVPEIQRDIVYYHGVSGITIRELSQKGLLNKKIKLKLRDFILDLHKKGIFFRSLHSGNIIATSDGFALIDISNMKIFSRSLGKYTTARNLRHIRADHVLREIFQSGST
jgi:tRNA A-37 threonylcarbamoyl transferase component Bud32